MTQFNAKSLARLLVQVEREVLVEAVEIANLQALITTPTIQTIEELQGFFNLLSNLKIFGFQALEQILSDAKSELGPVTLSLGEFIIEQFVALADIGDVGSASSRKLDRLGDSLDVISSVLSNGEGLTLSREQLVTFETQLALVHSGLLAYISLSHEQYHPSPDAHDRLTRMLVASTAALAVLGIAVQPA